MRHEAGDGGGGGVDRDDDGWLPERTLQGRATFFVPLKAQKIRQINTKLTT